MFKETVSIVVALALLICLSAGSAFAAFDNFNLIRVVSDKTVGSTLEIATDLGNITTLSGLSNAAVGGGADAFTNFTQGRDFSNLSVNYFAVNRTTILNGTMYIGANTTTVPVTGGVAQVQNSYAITSTYGPPTPISVNKYYSTLTLAPGSTSTVIANKTNASSLSEINGSTTLGGYKGYTGMWASNTNLNLASIANAPIGMTVYRFGATTGTNMATQLTGVKVLDLTTNDDGSTTINASAPVPTPIPAAAWLLGSGLMGLFGLRRKMNA